jgi:hypothetical protein
MTAKEKELTPQQQWSIYNEEHVPKKLLAFHGSRKIIKEKFRSIRVDP